MIKAMNFRYVGWIMWTWPVGYSWFWIITQEIISKTSNGKWKCFRTWSWNRKSITASFQEAFSKGFSTFKISYSYSNPTIFVEIQNKYLVGTCRIRWKILSTSSDNDGQAWNWIRSIEHSKLSNGKLPSEFWFWFILDSVVYWSFNWWRIPRTFNQAQK